MPGHMGGNFAHGKTRVGGSDRCPGAWAVILRTGKRVWAAATVARAHGRVILRTGKLVDGRSDGRPGRTNAAHGPANERWDARVGGRAGQKNGMFTKLYYLHAFGTCIEGSGACMFTKVYYLHASGRREPRHAHKSVLFTRTLGECQRKNMALFTLNTTAMCGLKMGFDFSKTKSPLALGTQSTCIITSDVYPYICPRTIGIE